MQSPEQIEKIIYNKVHTVTNKKVIEDMNIAINNIKQEDQSNKRYAIIGLTILAPIIAYFIFSITLLMNF